MLAYQPIVSAPMQLGVRFQEVVRPACPDQTEVVTLRAGGTTG